MTKQKPKNPKALRRSNKSTIAYMLLQNGDMSRVQLAKATGLTAASITQLVQEMTLDGAVSESGEVKSDRRGRREVMVHFEGERFAAVGVNIESDNTHISVCTPSSVICEKIFATSQLIEKSDVSKLRQELQDIVANWKYDAKLLGIGVGITGEVDEEKGISVNSYGILKPNFALGDELKKGIECNVEIINNVRAQARALILDNNENFMLIKHSPGLGCAVVVDGRVVNGTNGRAGEIGHTIVKPNGEKCRCGKRGCLEAQVSELHIEQLYEQKTGVKLPIGQIYGKYSTDAVAKAILDESMDFIAVAIGNATMLTDPLRVLVTGGIFFDKELLNGILARLENLGFGDAFKISVVGNEKRIKAFAGAKHIILKQLFEV